MQIPECLTESFHSAVVSLPRSPMSQLPRMTQARSPSSSPQILQTKALLHAELIYKKEIAKLSL